MRPLPLHRRSDGTPGGTPLAGLPLALTRRRFLEAMGASLAAAGLAGCDAASDAQEVFPYVHEPEQVVPGRRSNRFYATSLTHAGFAEGVLVESHMGRPLKVEGNPDHPASLGATSAQAQAAVLQLWDPGRSRSLLHRGEPSTWRQLEETLRAWRAAAAPEARVRLLTGELTSPTLLRQIGALQRTWPGLRWHVHEPAGRERSRAGAHLATGQRLDRVLHLDQAEVVVGLDADPFTWDPGAVRYAHDAALRRRVRAGAPTRMSRLYAVEPTPTLFGSWADHRLPLAPRQVERLALHLAARLGVNSGPGPRGELGAEEARWVAALADALQGARGRGLVIVGEGQPARVHALALLIDQALGNLGNTSWLVEPPHARDLPGLTPQPFGPLLDELRGEQVDLLLVVGVDPARDLPGLDVAGAIGSAGLSIHAGLYLDATARACAWHAPLLHELESWGDARAYDGTAGLLQPLIEPLGRGFHPAALLGLLLGDEALLVDPRQLVQSTWGVQEDPAWWEATLRLGVIPGSASPPRDVTLDAVAVREALAAAPPPAEGAPEGASLALQVLPDRRLFDGRYAPLSWLQELPDPLTRLTWGTAALIAPADARARGIASGQLVRLSRAGREATLPALIQPGQAEGCVTVFLGHARRAAERLRTRGAPWSAEDLLLAPLDEHEQLALVQLHDRQEDRPLALQGTLATFRQDPAALVHEVDPPERTFFTDVPGGLAELEPGLPQWGMSIDLSVCNGCGACTIACQAENNIPAVGREGVLSGRVMHWLRIDRYYHGPVEDPGVRFQPLACVHCAHAPCELVCPVEATTHSADGLNEMTYNRCIGTRYCSNNCPYKVRRFNFFAWADAALAPLWNPDVTVRGRGVMEKCTYCVQRIRAAGIAARAGDRPLRGEDVVTACQAACPTRAILFGDIREGPLALEQAQPHAYALLAELNTRPRTTYLAAVRNEDPALAREPAPEARDDEGHG